MENRNFQNILWELLRVIAAFAVAVLAACLVMNRMIEISGIRETQAFSGELSARIRAVEDNMENLREEFLHSEGKQQTTGMYETLRGKKIVNAEGYKRYYVPQLIDLFQKLMPAE